MTHPNSIIIITTTLLSPAACTPAPEASETTTSTTSTGSSTTTTTTESSTTTPSIPEPEDAAPGEIDLKISAQSFTLLDLDGDGHIDIIADGPDSAVQVLRNRGDGSFELPRNVGDRLDAPALAIAGGDFDSDGALDLAVLWGKHVAILRDAAGGPRETLHFPVSPLYSPFDEATALVAIGGDLFLTAPNMLVHRSGHPSGHLELQPPLALGGEPADVVAADLDGDGLLDLVSANYGTNDLSLLRAKAPGTFHPQTLIPVGDHPFIVLAADLDADGILDLLVRDINGLVTLRGLGDAQFAAPRGTALPAAYSTENADLAVCDRDGDARPEVLATHNINGRGWLAQLHPDADAQILKNPEFLRVGGGVGQIACADLDGDARDDLVFSTGFFNFYRLSLLPSAAP